MECSILNPRQLQCHLYAIFQNCPVLGHIPAALHFSNLTSKPLETEVLPLFSTNQALPFGTKVSLKSFTHLNHSAVLCLFPVRTKPTRLGGGGWRRSWLTLEDSNLYFEFSDSGSWLSASVSLSDSLLFQSHYLSPCLPVSNFVSFSVSKK